VITPIDFDHESFLGGTIEQIAAEKAGILKPGVPAVFAAQRPEAARVLEARAAELHLPVKLAEEYEARDIQITARGSQFNGITCPLAGEHQLANAITAVLACEALGVPPEGIAEARWPGRLEVVAPNPDILLDGAHNPAGGRALARYLERFYPNQGTHGRRWMIFGAMRDKAIEEIGGILFPLADELIFTAANYSRSLRTGSAAGNRGPRERRRECRRSTRDHARGRDAGRPGDHYRIAIPGGRSARTFSTHQTEVCMTSKARDVKTYIAEVPEERRAAIKKLRALCRKTLTGFTESIEGGFSYKRDGVIEVGFISQKHSINVYVCKKGVVDEFREALVVPWQRGQYGQELYSLSNPNKIDFAVLERILRKYSRSKDIAARLGQRPSTTWPSSPDRETRSALRSPLHFVSRRIQKAQVAYIRGRGGVLAHPLRILRLACGVSMETVTAARPDRSATVWA
jgi:hypothetical protein